MKTNFLFLSAFVILLASCKNETITIEKIVQSKENNSIKAAENSVDIKENESAIITKQRVVEFNSDFSNIDEFKNNLNKFIIHAELNKSTSGPSILKCETQSSPHDKKKFEQQFGSLTLSTDLLIDLNDIVSQKETLNCTIETDKSTLIAASFEIKKDLLLSQSGDLNKSVVAGNNDFGALVFEEGVVVQTLGTNLTLKAEQLISSDAMITTFRDATNTRASNNQDGRSGGILNINATQAFGRLNIHMVGQNGGLVTATPKKIEERPTVDETYNGLPLITEWVETCDDRGYRTRCYGNREASQCPTDGKKGIRGHKGRKGFNGRLGGNSGIANIYIADGTNFNVDVKLSKGSGSLAGSPGEGGPGSLGGAAGSYDPAYIDRCNNIIPSAGASGETGELGEVGLNGNDGAQERASYIDLKNNIKLEF